MKRSANQVTAKDVAALAGVSISTVSRVLSDHPAISQKTKNAVREACQALRYIPDISARSLLGRKSNTIAVVVPDISNPYFSSICAAIEKRASECGYHILLMNTLHDPLFESVAIDRMLSQQVDGFLISACSLQSQATHAELLKDTPCVYIGGNHDLRCSYVEGNNEQGAYEATQYLHRLGHREIIFIGGKYGARTLGQRLAGYRRAMLQNGLSCHEITPPENTYDSYLWCCERAEILFERNLIPDAFIAYSDVDAIYIFQAADKFGFHIPDDFSIISFDDLPICQLSLIGLTSVTMHKSRLGSLAFDRLLEKINGDHQQTVDILQPELMIRSSCRKI